MNGKLDKLSASERVQLAKLVAELQKRALREDAQSNFLPFVEFIWPEFISGEHHRRIAKIFDEVAAGTLKRVIINLAPRHTKSEFASKLLPAWFLGRYPNKKVMQVSNTAGLAEGFGRDVRNMLATDVYQSVFPEVQ